MRFLIIADSHIGSERPYEGVVRKLSRHSLPLIERLIEESAVPDAVGPPLDFVVQLGDLIEDESPSVDEANFRKGVEAFGKSKVPVLHVIGNHEQVFLNVRQMQEMTSQPLYYSRDFDDYRVIVLFSSSREHTDIHVDAPQLKWLADRLFESTTPVVVFMHHPLDEQSLGGNVWFEKYPDYCFCEERAEIRKMFEASGKVLAVFSGHVHQNSDTEINGIRYITVQSLVERMDDGSVSGAHAIVDIGVDAVSVQFLRANAAGD